MDSIRVLTLLRSRLGFREQNALAHTLPSFFRQRQLLWASEGVPVNQAASFDRVFNQRHPAGVDEIRWGGLARYVRQLVLYRVYQRGIRIYELFEDGAPHNEVVEDCTNLIQRQCVGSSLSRVGKSGAACPHVRIARA